MKRHWMAALGVFATTIGVAVALGWAPAAVDAQAGPPRTITPARTPDPSQQNVQFLSRCRYSHSKTDDPIVYPFQPGRSHNHDFFGNTTTNATSTYDSLLAGGTTCGRTKDTAAYWVPSLMDNGVTQRPLFVNAYYLTRGKTPSSIQPFPAGLRVIAGDAQATGPGAGEGVFWSCRAIDGSASTTTVPTCPAGSNLVMHIRFPDCWDGRAIDATDHKSHMAYNRRGVCPATHPVPVPALSVNAHFQTRGGPGVTLSSGGPFTAHADFFNAWNQPELERLVRECLNATKHCGATGP